MRLSVGPVEPAAGDGERDRLRRGDEHAPVAAVEAGRLDVLQRAIRPVEAAVGHRQRDRRPELRREERVARRAVKCCPLDARRRNGVHPEEQAATSAAPRERGGGGGGGGGGGLRSVSYPLCE